MRDDDLAMMIDPVDDRHLCQVARRLLTPATFFGAARGFEERRDRLVESAWFLALRQWRVRTGRSLEVRAPDRADLADHDLGNSTQNQEGDRRERDEGVVSEHVEVHDVDPIVRAPGSVPNSTYVTPNRDFVVIWSNSSPWSGRARGRGTWSRCDL